MDVKIQFNLPFNLPYNIHSNIVKLCPNKTSPVFNVDHDTELLNFYSYIGEGTCCMKMCCHIFAAPAVSTHYVVFDSFFWWKKCASMWCLSALWVGWWTFGSCLVIFGLISFWPTLGIFGENPIQLEHSQMISILFRAILLVFHSPYNLPPCVIWRAIKKLYYKIMHLQMTSFFCTNFFSFWERHFLFKMVRKMSSFRQ